MLSAFVIDGFNFYHSIKKLPKNLRWFDYTAYCHHFLTKKDSLYGIFYCTAVAWFRPHAAARHEVYIKACEGMGINVIKGRFKKKNMDCPQCQFRINRHEEKETDVNVALTAYRLAAATDVEQIFLVSGDSDMIPAIRCIQQDFPKVRVGVVFPYNRLTQELKKEVTIYHKTSQKILPQFILPQKITGSDGIEIVCPPEWR